MGQNGLVNPCKFTTMLQIYYMLHKLVWSPYKFSLGISHQGKFPNNFEWHSTLNVKVVLHLHGSPWFSTSLRVENNVMTFPLMIRSSYSLLELTSLILFSLHHTNLFFQTLEQCLLVLLFEFPLCHQNPILFVPQNPSPFSPLFIPFKEIYLWCPTLSFIHCHLTFAHGIQNFLVTFWHVFPCL